MVDEGPDDTIRVGAPLPARGSQPAPAAVRHGRNGPLIAGILAVSAAGGSLGWWLLLSGDHSGAPPGAPISPGVVEVAPAPAVSASLALIPSPVAPPPLPAGQPAAPTSAVSLPPPLAPAPAGPARIVPPQNGAVVVLPGPAASGPATPGTAAPRPPASGPPAAGLAVTAQPGAIPPAVGPPAALPAALILGRPPAPPPRRAEAEILVNAVAAPELLQLRENPRVFVLLFPDLQTQGDALNRVAALIEKSGFPRDRVVTQTELAASIARSGDTADTWLYAHDYRTSDLLRFFNIAARDRVPLTPGEEWVWEQVGRIGATVRAGEETAVISTSSGGPGLDASMRAAMLKHEIGHGHYFTVPGFAAHVHRAWRERFTEAERSAFRAFLGREGYDTADENLMANETMAYLLFTPDERFFRPRLVNMSDAQVERLRGIMRHGLPVPQANP